MHHPSIAPEATAFGSNQWQVLRVCPTCEGTQKVPPSHGGIGNPDAVLCTNPRCERGCHRLLFRTADELRAYAADPDK